MTRRTLNLILFGVISAIIVVAAALTLPKLIADELFPVPPEIAAMIEQCKTELNLKDVDTALVLSIMKQESGFKTGATSGAGASGLMQIMPATAAGIQARSGIKGNIYDPKTNICMGVYHIAGLLGRYAGQANQVELALAAYNGGPGAAAGYPNNMPRETINYVRVVAGINYPAYQKRVSDKNFVETKQQMNAFEEVLYGVVGNFTSNTGKLTDVNAGKGTTKTPQQQVLEIIAKPFYVQF